MAWLSQLANRYPHYPHLNKGLMKAIEYPLLEHIIRRKINPAESYNFWEYHCKGFSITYRDLVKEDVSDKVYRDVRTAVTNMTTATRKVPVFKITGWPRLGFLSKIFEDAKFIHVIRDGRAVANSLINVNFWKGWHGPDQWRWGPLTKTHQLEWEQHNCSFIALAAIQWKILMMAAEETKASIKGSNYLEVKYEDLCFNPIEQFKEITTFAGLEWSSQFEAGILEYRLKNTNEKWRQDLTSNQQETLNLVLKDSLVKYGYTP